MVINFYIGSMKFSYELLCLAPKTLPLLGRKLIKRGRFCYTAGGSSKDRATSSKEANKFQRS